MDSASTDPNKQPVTPRRAASVLMIREGNEGLEVFVQHRVSTMDFAAGMVVYPGGRVDAQDLAEAQSGNIPQALAIEHARLWEDSSIWEDGEEQAILEAATLLAAARREIFEETGARLDVSQLRPWANWITPPDNPKRFDTFFYVAQVQPGQAPMHQTTEASNSEWVQPAKLFSAYERGEVGLMTPTRTTLRNLAALETVEAAMSSQTPIVTVRPQRMPPAADSKKERTS
ncbi:NUDIX hydrolase [Arthrobacter sp. MYb211]|uniref:NUDIX hydrolase n=1 Tax=unclassified Arthrobacter TaxID=235627 RepID=UPI000CFBEC1E|nr:MULTISPECIES: NUDIX hydrolase [unclassified Arthrobacter]PRA12357.1 NUDIX hydrolase [Arthrobacter sp. MYb221]PRC08820.1 NUDIX hydrolase [Arthrobacter sp. MYb211]